MSNNGFIFDPRSKLRTSLKRMSRLSSLTVLHTHILIKVHEIRDHFDVGVVNSSLSDDLLQDVPQPGREDEHRNVVQMQPVEELLITLPAIDD